MSTKNGNPLDLIISQRTSGGGTLASYHGRKVLSIRHSNGTISDAFLKAVPIAEDENVTIAVNKLDGSVYFGVTHPRNKAVRGFTLQESVYNPADGGPAVLSHKFNASKAVKTMNVEEGVYELLSSTPVEFSGAKWYSIMKIAD